MCKIITIIANGEASTDDINCIINAQVPALSSERSGYSISRDGKASFYMKDKAYNRMGTNIAYKGEKTYIVHTRTRTAGSSGVDGLHLQTLDNRYQFAHNGTVSRYASTTTKSDSYLFFRDLVERKVSAISIEEHMDDTGFWGRGILYDMKTKTIHIFNNATLYLYAIKGALIFSSFALTLEEDIYTSVTVLGYEYRNKVATRDIRDTVPLLFQEKLENKYLMFQDGKFKNESDLDIARTYNSYSYPVKTFPAKTYDSKTKSWNNGGGFGI